jgi:DNA-binding NarL/FixJ family response regulator
MRPKASLNGSDYQPAAAIVMALKLAGAPDKLSTSPLSGAETRVLALVAHAKTNKEIAHDLGISPATVKRHLENVLSKLGFRNRVQAAIYGVLVNGCAGRGSSGCAVQTWCKELDSAHSEWAD